MSDGRRVSCVCRAAIVALVWSLLLGGAACLTGERQERLAVLKNESAAPAQRDAAIEALAKIGPAAAPGLVDLLSSDSPQVQVNGRNALVKIGAPAIPALLEAARAPLAARGREELARVLGKIGPEALPGVRPLLRDADPKKRQLALDVMFELGLRAQSEVPAAIAALKDDDPEVRGMAAGALSVIDPDRAEAVKLLIEAVRDPDSGHLAAVYMSNLGAAARSAVPALVAELNNTERPANQRLGFLYALRDLGPEAAGVVPALLATLQDEQRSLRLMAALSLGNFGRPAESALPALRELAKTGDSAMRRTAREAIRKIAPETLPAEE